MYRIKQFNYTYIFIPRRIANNAEINDKTKAMII